MNNIVCWSTEKPKKRLITMDCDEVHINSKILTIYNGKEHKEVDLANVTKVTFGTLSARRQCYIESTGQHLP